MIKEIIEDIKNVNKMIDMHSNDKNDPILEQYQYKRDKTISELEIALESLKDFDVWKEWRYE